MDALTFSISGTPIAKGRPRATLRGGFARLYTPAETKKYESAVKRFAALAMRGRKPFEGPLSVSIRFRLGLPKSMSKKDQAAKLAGEAAYLGTKDIDNLGKAVLDALNEVAWVDDVQIVRLFLTKAASSNPGVDIKITPLGEPNAGSLLV
jgi:Holliday junction resolvase RusA-like endonuclease